MFNRVCIVGIGLIGGSFGLALKKHGLAREVWGVARRQTTLDDAIASGTCDHATADVLKAATGADMVFLSPPVGQMLSICEQIAPVIAPNALVTDAGSTKAQLVAECEPIFTGKARFIGGHPMAGSEKTGPSAARADLFEGATWILTPTEETDPTAFLQLKKLVKTLGAKPLSLAPDEHDNLVAVASHLPHITASALMHPYMRAKALNPDVEQIVAGGWRDSTRVAAGSPEMWRDICVANRAALTTVLEEFIGELEYFKTLLGDCDSLLDWFDEAARERQNFNAS